MSVKCLEYNENVGLKVVIVGLIFSPTKVPLKLNIGTKNNTAVWRQNNVSPYITIVQIIFHFLWDHWAHCCIIENGVLLMYTLEGVSSVANFITAHEESQ